MTAEHRREAFSMKLLEATGTCTKSGRKAPIISASQTGKNGTKGSGPARNGKQLKPSSCDETLPVGIVELILRCPIIRIGKSMECPNTSILAIPKASAAFVTMEFIPGSISVLHAEKFNQSPLIHSAINALNHAIASELNSGENTGNGNPENTASGSTGSTIPGKSSTRGPERGQRKNRSEKR